MNVPDDLRYTDSHEWIRPGVNDVTVGITDHAQNQLTDIVFVDLPAVGSRHERAQPICVVESVKAASDIYAPVAGVVAEVNGELDAATELVNQDPYGAGWFFKLKDVDPSALEPLMNLDQYKSFCGE